MSLTSGSNILTIGTSNINLTSGPNLLIVSPTTGTNITGSLSASGLTTLSGTTVSGAGGLTVSGGPTLCDGSFTSTGVLTVNSPSGISIPSGGLTASGAVSAGSLSGDGGLITFINGSNISTGTLNDGRLSANIPKLNTPNIFTGPLISGPASPGQDAIIGIANGQTQGAPANLAGKFYGNVNITGNLTKGSGTFKIDHPLDPKNKYLYHSFVESPDMMNIYTGSIVLDSDGKATVELPEWFESLNKDFHYQLTCIGGFAQVFVSKEIEENKFEISGGKNNMKVSWQVTGTRNDAYAKKYRVVVEEEKPISERGTYLHPEVFKDNQ